MLMLGGGSWLLWNLGNKRYSIIVVTISAEQVVAVLGKIHFGLAVQAGQLRTKC